MPTWLTAAPCAECGQMQTQYARSEFYVCYNRACAHYVFRDLRTALGRPRNLMPMRQPRTRPRHRRLKPGEAVIRYNDGSRYTMSRVMQVARDPRGGVEIVQALPTAATTPGVVVHLIPAHNVDVVSFRRRDVPESLIDHHEHCLWCGDHHESAGCDRRPWYVKVWGWLVRE